MAKKHENVTINDVNYERHVCHVTTKKLVFDPETKVRLDTKIKHQVGFAMVESFSGENGPADFIDFINELNESQIKDAIADWKYGKGVRLQRDIRTMTSPDTSRKEPTDVERAKIADAMPADDQIHYQGRYSALQLEIKRIWLLGRVDATIDLTEYENRNWTELV